jgi:hypothetical protein
MTNYKQILEDAGFTSIGHCSCGGTRQEKFKRHQYTVYIKTGKQTFRIKQHNTFITQSKPVNLLNETLAVTLTGVN